MPHLRFDINAMAALEEVTGEKSFLTIVNNKEKMASFRMLRALYWAGTDTKASLEEAGEKLSEELKKGKTLLQVIGEITEALNDSFPIPSGGEAENPPKSQTV